jgi:hypothetical protein
VVLGAQPVAHADELRDLRLERIELRIHGSHYLSNLSQRQEIRGVSASGS